MSFLRNTSLTDKNIIILKHLQARIKCLEEQIEQKDCIIDQLNDNLTKLRLLTRRNSTPSQPQTPLTPPTNHTYQQNFISSILSEPPSFKSFDKIWQLFDRYVEIQLIRPQPARLLTLFSELKTKPWDKWSQLELDGITELLMREVEKGQVGVAQKKIVNATIGEIGRPSLKVNKPREQTHNSIISFEPKKPTTRSRTNTSSTDLFHTHQSTLRPPCSSLLSQLVKNPSTDSRRLSETTTNPSPLF